MGRPDIFQGMQGAEAGPSLACTPSLPSDRQWLLAHGSTGARVLQTTLPQTAQAERGRRQHGAST